jgi:hypothetical protein
MPSSMPCWMRLFRGSTRRPTRKSCGQASASSRRRLEGDHMDESALKLAPAKLAADFARLGSRSPRRNRREPIGFTLTGWTATSCPIFLWERRLRTSSRRGWAL